MALKNSVDFSNQLAELLIEGLSEILSKISHKL